MTGWPDGDGVGREVLDLIQSMFGNVGPSESRFEKEAPNGWEGALQVCPPSTSKSRLLVKSSAPGL